MPNLNKVMLIGHAGRDAEQRFTPSGTAVANFSMAVSRRRGEQEETEWFRVTVWAEQAQRIADQVTKGATVYVEGRVGLNTFQRNDGQQGASLEVNANLVLVLSGGSNRQQQAAPQQSAQGGQQQADESLPW